MSQTAGDGAGAGVPSQQSSDQLTKLTQMIMQQQQLLKAQAEEMTRMAAKINVIDDLSSTLVKVEADLSDVQDGLHGDGNGGGGRVRRSAAPAVSGAEAAQGGSSSSGGGGSGSGSGSGDSSGGRANSGGGPGHGPHPLAVKLDVCPKMGKEQSMREWTNCGTRWEKGLPVVV